jgi:hypothetical protein
MADSGTHVPPAPAFLQASSGTYTSTALNGFPDSKQDRKWVDATIHFELMGQGYLETGTVAATSPGSVTFNYVSQAGGPGDPAAGDPFYITGKLACLDTAGEWFRDATTKTLYLWTPTGDSPGSHVVEAKARTFGFDLSALSYITIRGIHFFSCSINTTSASTHDTIDGIQALYVSHFEQASGAQTLWTPHMEDTGVIIRGSNNILENSEIGFSAGNGVLLEGNNTSLATGNVVTNNVIHDVDYMCLDEAGINSGNPLYPPGNGKGPSLYDATSTYNTINLSWTAHSKNQAGFKIQRSTNAQAFMEIGTAGANDRIYQDTTGSPNTSCYYRLRAYNQSSGNSAYSNVAASRAPPGTGARP